MKITIKFEFHLHISKSDGGHVEKKADETTVTAFLTMAEKEVEKQKRMKRDSTIENYRTALRSLRRYIIETRPPEDIGTDLMEGFEHWMRSRRLRLNTVSCYMRSLRSLATKVMGEEARSFFSKSFTGSEKTQKRAIDPKHISKLQELKLKPGSALSLTRDLFLFSFYALGMPFVDMAQLRMQQINDHEIVYSRQKTGQRICVPLEPCLRVIINRYQQADSDYVFPMLRSSATPTHQTYLNALRRYNRNLKQLAKMSHISIDITSYVARHSWASSAFRENVGLSLISKALGHSNPQNTLTYIRQINDTGLRKASRSVIKSISKT